MQHFLLAIILVFSFLVSGQIGNAPVTNSVNQTETLIVPSEDLRADTISIQLEKSTTKEKGSSQKKADKYHEDEAMKDADQSANASPAQGAAQTFSRSKTVASQSRTQRTPSVQAQSLMDQAVEELATSAPESFEYNFFAYQAGNYNIDLIDHLKKAEALRPNNSDVQIQLTSYHIINGENDLAKECLIKLQKSTRLSPEVILYAQDLLLSAPENGTLITHGFDDAYGAYYQQLHSSLRQDVNLISLDFLQSPQYREKLKELDYLLPKSEVIDVSFLKEFCVLNSSKNIAISSTVPKEYLTRISDKLYVVGLVLEYKTEASFDNFNRNEQLWENVLTKTAAQKVLTEKGRQLSANYLPMLLQLSQVYNQTGEFEKQKNIDAIIDQIAVQANKYEQVKKLKQSY